MTESLFHSKGVPIITAAFKCREKDIAFISTLNRGMTNRSYLFSVHNKKYILRIPGEGTEQLIARKDEAEVFKVISGHGLCDDPVFIDPESGFKITEFLDGVRHCDPDNRCDLILCMEKLRNFHKLKLKVSHTFDIFGKIDFYESLRNGKPSVFPDYEHTKHRIFEKREMIEKMPKDWCLTHIDAVCDNFLFYFRNDDGIEDLQLTDWEYSGMQDPHVDLAMFALYSCYTKEQTDDLIHIYFGGDPGDKIRSKIYYYMAACGLLWSNWTEYKSELGVEFGDYGEKQYSYAKEFIHYCHDDSKRSFYVCPEKCTV